MPAFLTSRWTRYLLWITGLGLIVWLLVSQGIGDIRKALETAGWGLLAISAYYSLPLTCNVLGWWATIPRRYRDIGFFAVWRARWIGGAVNDLLPVGKIGGDIVRARLIALRGVPGPWAGASVVTEVTSGIATQLLFALAGIGLLAGRSGSAHATLLALAGVGVFAVLLAGFFVAQRLGLFHRAAIAMERLFQTDEGRSIVGDARALDQAIREIYRQGYPVLWAGFWRLVGWVAGVGEVWLALYFLGHPVRLVTALILESLIQTVRNAAFMVPGALGVQEGAFIVLGHALGLPADVSLVLSLVKRVREILTSLPALALWQWSALRRPKADRAAAGQRQ